MTCIIFIFTAFSDDTVYNQSFNERVVILENETRYLCTHIQEKSLITAKKFNFLMQDAHIHCPDYKGMKVTLDNLEENANKYYSFVQEQLRDCQSLSYMLTKSLNNYLIVIDFFMEGNYSLATSIIDIWYESFTKFRVDFYVKDTPLEIIRQYNKALYYDSSTYRIIDCIQMLFIVLALSIVLSKILYFIDVVNQHLNYLSVFVITFVIFSSITLNNDLDLIFVSKSMQINWYPDAVKTFEVMVNDRVDLQFILSRQIHSIEELQRHISMYSDKTVMKNVDQFVQNLGTAVRQVTKELSDAYVASKQMTSTFRRSYGFIERKAKKAGRLHDSNSLLAELNKTSNKYEELQRSLESLIIHQQKILPILIEQIKSIRTILQEGHLIDISHVINNHQEVIMDISGNTYEVKIQVDEMIEIVDDGQTHGLKKTIESLKDDTVANQLNAIVSGIVVTGATSFVGMLTLKSGFSMVAITVTSVSGPIIGAGIFGFGIFNALFNFEKYNYATRYKSELEMLEMERLNLIVAMMQLQKYVNDQQNSLTECQLSLNNISMTVAQYSTIPHYTLNNNHRTTINNELVTILQQYNNMMGFYDLFPKNMAQNHQVVSPTHQINDWTETI